MLITEMAKIQFTGSRTGIMPIKEMAKKKKKGLTGVILELS